MTVGMSFHFYDGRGVHITEVFERRGFDVLNA